MGGQWACWSRVWCKCQGWKVCLRVSVPAWLAMVRLASLACLRSLVAWKLQYLCRMRIKSLAILEIPCLGSMITQTRCVQGSSTMVASPCLRPSAKLLLVCTLERMPCSSLDFEQQLMALLFCLKLSFLYQLYISFPVAEF